jgi:diguanylate cyclase (GGDEF)-like protein/PAS domain S-box-containing protein
MKRFGGLRFRLLLASLLIEALMLLLLVSNSLRVIDQHLQRQTENRLSAIELAYKTAVALPLAARDYATLRDVLDGWRAAGDINYLAVTGPQGEVLATSGWPANTPLPEPGSLQADTDVLHVRFAVEVLGQHYGHVHYGLSMAFLKQARHDLMVQGALIASLELALSFLVLYGVGFWLTRHLAHLTQASHTMAEGRYDIRVPEVTHDEVGELTHNFNRMAQAVQAHVTELATLLEHQRQILQALGEGVYGQDMQGRCTFMNPAALAMLGYTEAEVLGHSVHALCHHHREDGAPFAMEDCPVHLSAGDGQLRHRDEWFWRKDGSGFPVALIVTPLLTGGLRRGTLASFRDMSQARRAEQALKDGHDRLRAYIEALPDIVVIKDGHSRWQMVNQAAVEMLQLQGYDWQGKDNAAMARERPAFRVFHEMAQHSDDQAWAQGRMWVGLEPIHPADGPARVSEVRKMPVFAADGSRLALMVIARDITEQERDRARIVQLAYHDTLTGLANRTQLLERLAQALNPPNASPGAAQGALLLLNLDRFKTINDARGHRAGDALLVAVGERLAQIKAAGDVLARMSSDEFALLLGTPAEPIKAFGEYLLEVTERIHAALRWPMRFAGEEALVSASVGIATFASGADTPQDVLRRADTALHQAKASGGNQSAFFDAVMGERSLQRFRIEHELHQGLAAGELRLYAQAQVTPAGAMVGAEALVRWQHPTRGLLPPGVFIGVAEESDLIIALENWVVRRSCQHMAQLEVAGRPLHLSVNISPRHFRQSGFVDWLIGVLRQEGCDPAYLTLEITEGMVVDNVDDLITKLNRLSALGVHFSIDDFGTGYSSLAYLKRLPIHELKIDKTFVQDAPFDPDDGALGETILSIARHLHLKVVAEGVETPEQAAFLNARAAVVQQGYFYGRPEPIEQFVAAWLGQNEPHGHHV